jgi:hypothetical protein
MDIKTKYGWQEFYATALLETDWTKIEHKIQAAENAIGARLHDGPRPLPRMLEHRVSRTLTMSPPTPSPLIQSIPRVYLCHRL